MGSFAQFPLFLPKLWSLNCQKMVHFWQFCVDLSKNSKSVKAIYSFQGRQTDSAGANNKTTLCISLSKPDWARKGRRCILSKSSHGILRILKTFQPHSRFESLYPKPLYYQNKTIETSHSVNYQHIWFWCRCFPVNFAKFLRISIL